MTDAPERILAWTYGNGYFSAWNVDEEESPPEAARYILATPSALSSHPEVMKLVTEAEARGMERAADWLEETAYVDASHRAECSGVIRVQAAAIRAKDTP